MSRSENEGHTHPDGEDEEVGHYVVPPDIELRRLREGPREGEVPVLGMPPDRIIARCPGNASLVLNRCCSVLETVFLHSREPWPTVEEWRTILPEWLVALCQEEHLVEPLNPLHVELYDLLKRSSRDAMDFWRAHREELARLAQERRQHEDEPWTVSGWIYWFEPQNRWWFWWDANVQDENTLFIDVENSDWPYPAEALLWLLQMAGATDARKEI